MAEPMPTAPPPATELRDLSGLARRLVLERMLDVAVARQIQVEALKERKPFAQIAQQRGLVPTADILVAQAIEFGLPLLDIGALDVSRAPMGAIRDDLMVKHAVIPLRRRGNRLSVAHGDPTQTKAIDDIRFQSNLVIDSVMALSQDIKGAIDRLLNQRAGTAMDESMGGMGQDDEDDEAPLSEEDAAAARDADITVAERDTPAVKFVKKGVQEAIRRGASDIHFEPYENEVRIRLRMDGLLKTVARAPTNLRNRITARLKVMAQLDISEKRRPQDGRMRVRLGGGREMDFRVSCLPTMYGEKIVMRALDAGAAKLGIDKLGYEPEQKKLYLDALAKPYGMILVTGPTGSGKTVSLYTGLNILNTEDRNISTAEDPVEIRLFGINQVQINEKQGLTFEGALRSFLRQDPDVIMVGEIRDFETAEIAIKAAQTGHLVLSTLHTNDAPQTIARLVQMKIAPYNVIASVRLVIAQRLVRRLHACKSKRPPVAPDLLKAMGFTDQDIAAGITLYDPVGCDDCNGGYKGRTGIYQVMPMTERIQHAILAGGSALDIAAAAAADGVGDLRRSALNRVMDGTIDIHEADRVTLA